MLDQVLAARDLEALEWLDGGVMRRLRDSLARRQPLAWYTYSYLWGLVFGGHWIRRAQEAARGASR